MKKLTLITLTALLSLAFAVHGEEKSPSQPEAGKQQQSAPQKAGEGTAKLKEHEQANKSSPGYEHEQRGDEYLQQRKFQEALKEFDAAIAADPKAQTAYVKKGIALYGGTNSPQDAIPLMDKAIELNQRGKKWAWWPLYHKGMAQGISGDLEGALKTLDQSIKLDSNYDNHVGRAIAYSHAQKPDKALEDVKAAMRHNPEDKRLAGVVENLEGQIKAAKYLDEMAAKKGAEKTASGLVYFEIKKGSGKSPAATDNVKVHYHGTLPDGTVFDSSVDRKEPATFPLNGVIPCWTEGLQKMQVGGKSKLVCPAGIAYGNQGAGPMIKPGATLVFEVELLGIE